MEFGGSKVRVSMAYIAGRRPLSNEVRRVSKGMNVVVDIAKDFYGRYETC